MDFEVQKCQRMGSSLSAIVFQPPKVSYMYMYTKKQIIWLSTKRDANIPAFYIGYIIILSIFSILTLPILKYDNCCFSI
jgi:hypothetical protein